LQAVVKPEPSKPKHELPEASLPRTPSPQWVIPLTQTKTESFASLSSGPESLLSRSGYDLALKSSPTPSSPPVLPTASSAVDSTPLVFSPTPLQNESSTSLPNQLEATTNPDKPPTRRINGRKSLEALIATLKYHGPPTVVTDWLLMGSHLLLLVPCASSSLCFYEFSHLFLFSLFRKYVSRHGQSLVTALPRQMDHQRYENAQLL
jgi:hypothetical protein